MANRVCSALVAVLITLGVATAHAAVVTQYEFENNLSDTGAGGAFADGLSVTNGGAAVYALGVNGSSVRIGGILATDALNLSATSTADLNLGSTWSLETYMKPSDTAGFQRTMLKWGTSYHFGVRNGGLDLFINGAANPIAAQGAVPLNRWSHLVVSNDASNGVNGLKGYVNGALVYSGPGVNVTNGARPAQRRQPQWRWL